MNPQQTATKGKSAEVNTVHKSDGALRQALGLEHGPREAKPFWSAKMDRHALWGRPWTDVEAGLTGGGPNITAKRASAPSEATADKSAQ